MTTGMTQPAATDVAHEGTVGGARDSYCVVIPTLGRSCLTDCLAALAAADGPLPQQVVLVDDRRDTPSPLPVCVPEVLADRTTVVTLEGRGPAAARNAGWRATAAAWIAFLDDDVQVGPRWRAELAADLGAQPDYVAGVQGVISVPLPAGRRPTDWERGTAGLAGARWITADMAYRRRALLDAGGFDERFPRPFREDVDLALRLMSRGWKLARGGRSTSHPVRPAPRWASLRAQAGNADDALMLRLHGRDWRDRAGAARGRRAGHWVTTGLAAFALAGLAARPRPRALRAAAAAAGLGWLSATGEFAAARIRCGPRTRAEITEMLITSALIPPLAVTHWLRGWWRSRHVPAWPPRPAAVLFDRDGTLIRDVPYNTSPDLVQPVPGAAAATGRLRRAGVRLGVVTNQSGVGRGMISPDQLAAVNQRVNDLLGPFGCWAVCPHAPADDCECRKPRPLLVQQAAASLGVEPADCVVIGDIGADAAAAYAAGARAILVPTPVTRPSETAGVPAVASLAEAVGAVLGGAWPQSWPGQGDTS
jgi:histidinol-phosphate phosphatase family protein